MHHSLPYHSLKDLCYKEQYFLLHNVTAVIPRYQGTGQVLLLPVDIHSLDLHRLPLNRRMKLIMELFIMEVYYRKLQEKN